MHHNTWCSWTIESRYWFVFDYTM